jgi:hypothetical protein
MSHTCVLLRKTRIFLFVVPLRPANTLENNGKKNGHFGKFKKPAQMEIFR